MNDFSFFSPTGDELQGTLETMQGAASVRFETPDRLFSHTGANTEFHNGRKTNEIQGVPLFVDASGEEWLLHHLIPQDEPLTTATIDLLNHEYHIGMALETARNLKSAVSTIAGNYVAPALASLPDRSDEHTSELQSLMRISYPGFCSKKK